MDRIETGPLERDREQFMKLLEAVRDEAREDGHWRLVSVSLEARHIDPLAVLGSIYEAGERHAYIEHPAAGEALAGAEAVIEAEFAGAERFARARAWCEELFEHTVAVGQLELSFAGPHVFCGFAFEDEADADAAFAPATLFVPRWQVAAAEGGYVVTANLLVEPDGDLEAEAARVLAAHEKFSAFDYSRAPGADGDAEPDVERVGDSREIFAESVGRGLAAIRAGRCRKVVLSRRERYEAPAPLHPLRMLNRLRERFPGCRSFSFANGRGQSFIGATPERLLSLRAGRLETEAIAGTAGRGATAAEDAALAAGLIESDKEQREHGAVAEFITDRLRSLGLEPGPDARPRLLRLPNVQHMVTPFRMEAPEGLHLLDAAERLHPTPAVGGLPQAEALALLGEIEHVPRGLYAGLVGWINSAGEGELAVCLRSGLVDGHSATLYAGTGIVEGSDPEAEAAETDAKLAAMVEALAEVQS